jgi:putative sigma-54 modulation protein
MNLDIRYVNLPVSDALEEFTRTRLTRALRPFRGHVERITVRLEDINGPRGALDKRCSVTTAELAAVKRKVVVENKSSDAYADRRVARDFPRLSARERARARPYLGSRPDRERAPWALRRPDDRLAPAGGTAQAATHRENSLSTRGGRPFASLMPSPSRATTCRATARLVASMAAVAPAYVHVSSGTLG